MGLALIELAGGVQCYQSLLPTPSFIPCAILVLDAVTTSARKNTKNTRLLWYSVGPERHSVFDAVTTSARKDTKNTHLLWYNVGPERRSVFSTKRHLLDSKRAGSHPGGASTITECLVRRVSPLSVPVLIIIHRNSADRGQKPVETWSKRSESEYFDLRHPPPSDSAYHKQSTNIVHNVEHYSP